VKQSVTYRVLGAFRMYNLSMFHSPPKVSMEFSIVDPCDVIDFCRAVSAEACSEGKRAALEKLYALACYRSQFSTLMYIDGAIRRDYNRWLDL